MTIIKYQIEVIVQYWMGIMNSLKEWWNNKKVYQKVLIIIVELDLLILILGVTFFYENLVFSYFLLLNIIILFDMIPISYLIRLYEQPISSEKYYLKNIDTNYRYMDESLLTKLFEIRINNRRQFMFAYLILIVTFTLTIAFNPEASNYFKGTMFGVSGYHVSGYQIVTAAGVIGTLVLVFYTFGIDRLTIGSWKSYTNLRKN